MSAARPAAATFAVLDRAAPITPCVTRAKGTLMVLTSPRVRLLSPAAAPGEAVLRTRRGRTELLTSRAVVRIGDVFQVVDTREQLLTLAPQSIATAEGIDVSVTATVTVRAVDPVAVATVSADPMGVVYLAAQIALRDLVAALPLERVLVRDINAEELLDAARAAAAPVGLEVLAAQVKDVQAPRRLQEAREEALVVELESTTALERARAEVKATRARLAAAQLLEKSPVLARIRELEALPPGSTVTLEPRDSLSPRE